MHLVRACIMFYRWKMKGGGCTPLGTIQRGGGGTSHPGKLQMWGAFFTRKLLVVVP